MAQFQRITQFSNKFSDNILSPKSALIDSPFNVTSGGANVSYFQDPYYGNFANIGTTTYKTTDISFNFGDSLTTPITRDGNYLFQFSIIDFDPNPEFFVAFNFAVQVFKNGALDETITGNMVDNVTLNSTKTITFAQNIVCNSVDTIDFAFTIFADTTYPFNITTFSIGNFKLEHDNKFLGLPSPYTYPFGYFQKSSDFTQIETDIQTLKTQTGWAQYVDNARTTTAPLVITDTTNFTTIPCNGATKDETQLPAGFTELFNTTTNKLIAKNVNDKFLLNVRFKARTSAANSSFTIGLDIGAANLVSPEDRNFSVGANTQQEFSFLTTYFTRETFIANGGLIKIRPRTGTLSIYDISIIPELTHKSR